MSFRSTHVPFVTLGSPGDTSLLIPPLISFALVTSVSLCVHAKLIRSLLHLLLTVIALRFGHPYLFTPSPTFLHFLLNRTPCFKPPKRIPRYDSYSDTAVLSSLFSPLLSISFKSLDPLHTSLSLLLFPFSLPFLPRIPPFFISLDVGGNIYSPPHCGRDPRRREETPQAPVMSSNAAAQGSCGD